MNPYSKSLIKWLIVAFLTLLLSTSNAQQVPGAYKIYGLVADSVTKHPLHAATVYLLNDSNQVLKTTITSTNGSFAFAPLDKMHYHIRVSVVGYRDWQKAADAVTANHTPLNIGTIYLVKAANTLNEVVVSASRPLVMQEADKLTYDLQADPESKGTSVLEMMRKVPFLSLDADQNILLNGSSSYRILINGKPSTLVERNPKDVLRSMPASTIKSIEVITSPSAKYDGEGLAGIINIITHKKIDNGYNGTINLSHRFPVGGPGIGGSFGIKSGKIGLSFMGGASRYNTPPVNSSVYRTTTGANATTLNQQNAQESNSKNRYLGAELSYEWDSLSLLSAQFNINANNGNSRSGQQSILEMETGLSQSFELVNNGLRKGNGTDAALNYQRGFKKSKDRLLTFSYRYLQNKNSMSDGIGIYNSVNYNSPDYHQLNKEHFSERTMQMDYVHGGQKLNIEAGAKGVFRNNESDYQFQLYDSLDRKFKQDLSRTDHFNNEQRILAVYNTFFYKTKSWAYKAGVRLEHTKVDARFAAGNAEVHQDYISIIPSASISRKFDKGSTLAFNYSNRIQRPSIYQLNPFVDRSNPAIERSGNPDLKPGIGNMLQISYNRSKKTTVNIAVTYMMFDNLIDRVSVYDPATNRTHVRFENAGKARITRTNFFLNYPVNKRLNVRMNSDLRYIVAYFNAGNAYIKNDVLMFYLSFSGSYRFENGWRLNGDVTGSTGGISGIQARSNGYVASSMSVQKDVVKDKLTFSASVSNPFSKYRHIQDKVQGTDFAQVTENHVYFRSFNISLNYRFGKLKEAVKKSKRGISNDDVELK